MKIPHSRSKVRVLLIVGAVELVGEAERLSYRTSVSASSATSATVYLRPNPSPVAGSAWRARLLETHHHVQTPAMLVKTRD
ncbi:MAG: hypothetical protein ACREA4_11805 [Nitrososphaera sp.]